MTKKLSALILSVIMAVALLPATVVAAEGSVAPVGASGYELTANDVDFSDGTITNVKNTRLTDIIIPEKIDGEIVTSIGYNAFAGCTSLTSVTFAENSQLTSIGEHAFDACLSLTSIKIPDSVTKIECGAFSNCERLESITIPNRVTEIGIIAFYGCKSLSSIEIPDSVTKIGWHAFWCCTSLETVILKPTTAPQIGKNAFLNCNENLTFTLPATSTGYHANGWEQYIPHDYDTLDIAKTTNDSHTYYCSYCGDSVIQTTAHTGGTATCTQKAICKDCGAKYGSLAAHNYSANLVNNGKQHWHNCLNSGCSEKANLADHTWNEGIVTIEPTYDATGIRTYTCNICKATKTETIAKLEKPTEPEKPTKPTKPVEVKPSEEEKRQQVITETRNEIETTPKGGSVTIDADDDENGVHWSIMDAARENGVGLKIEWNGKTIVIPAGKALNENYRTYYPYEYLARYDFKNNKPAEIPAIPETGVPINLIITLALIAFATTATAIVLKRKIK